MFENKIKQLPVTDTPTGKKFSVFTSLQQNRVNMLIRNTNAIVKNSRPFTDFLVDMLSLDEYMFDSPIAYIVSKAYPLLLL